MGHMLLQNCARTCSRNGRSGQPRAAVVHRPEIVHRNFFQLPFHRFDGRPCPHLGSLTKFCCHTLVGIYLLFAAAQEFCWSSCLLNSWQDHGLHSRIGLQEPLLCSSGTCCRTNPHRQASPNQQAMETFSRPATPNKITGEMTASNKFKSNCKALCLSVKESFVKNHPTNWNQCRRPAPWPDLDASKVCTWQGQDNLLASRPQHGKQITATTNV